MITEESLTKILEKRGLGSLFIKGVVYLLYPFIVMDRFLSWIDMDWADTIFPITLRKLGQSLFISLIFSLPAVIFVLVFLLTLDINNWWLLLSLIAWPVLGCIIWLIWKEIYKAQENIES